MKILVLNCGSSSIKYKLFDMTSGEVMAQGGIEKIGLKEHLSPTRSNGLLSMVKQMHLYALAFKVKNEK